MNTYPTNTLLAGSLVAASALAGCSIDSFYKQDTGEMPAVGPPPPAFVSVAASEPVEGDPDALPQVLEGEAPDGIQPLEPEAAEEAVMEEPEVMETYVVEKGDTFGHISQKLYGTVNRTTDLIAANPEIDPKKMQIGDVLNVPR